MNKSEAARLSWLDPEIRARRIAGLLRAWDDPVRLALSRKDRCLRGHEKTDANTLPDGSCRACNRIYGARWEAAHRAEKNARLRAWRRRKKEMKSNGS